MNYANSWQLAYNIGDNQQLAYAVLKTIRSCCSPTPMLGLMYRSRPASMPGPSDYMQNQHANYCSLPHLTLLYCSPTGGGGGGRLHWAPSPCQRHTAPSLHHLQVVMVPNQERKSLFTWSTTRQLRMKTQRSQEAETKVTVWLSVVESAEFQSLTKSMRMMAVCSISLVPLRDY